MSKKQEKPEPETRAQASRPADKPEAAADANVDEQGRNAQPSANAESATDEAEVQKLRDEAQEHHNNYLRALAEVENVRRRSEREIANAHRFGLEKFVGELLPVRDSLEMGLNAAEGEAADAAALREGTELTLRMLSQALEKFGVTEVNPRGEPFNPERHEAVSVKQTDEVAADTVVEVMQKGYLLNDRLIRPAMVVVARAPAAGNGSGDGQAGERA